MHNALKQISVKLPSLSLQGFSISGLATYIQVPELDCCFDMGECPLSALPINHVFLTHAHGDHSRCLMRHHSLRRMMGVERESTYYLPDFLLEGAKNWIRAEALFEGVPENRIQLPNLVPVSANGKKFPLAHRKDLWVEGFEVDHSQPSLGYTIYFHKKKLLPEYIGLPGQEIARLREAGTEITREVYEPKITFIGDCRGISIKERREIWDTPVLVLECTFLGKDDVEMASQKGHTHLTEIVECLEDFGDQAQFQQLVLKHFSMKYSKDYILQRVNELIPERFKERIVIFL